MSREYCTMHQIIGGNWYCDYFDYGCFKCEQVKNCPDGLDDDDEFDDEFDDDYEECE